jgi:hypothetical protein
VTSEIYNIDFILPCNELGVLQQNAPTWWKNVIHSEASKVFPDGAREGVRSVLWNLILPTTGVDDPVLLRHCLQQFPARPIYGGINIMFLGGFDYLTADRIDFRRRAPQDIL